MCSIQRPLDTKTKPRIAVEAEAILGVLALCEAGQVELMASDTLVFELERNPHPVRKEYALKVLSKATVFIPIDNQVEERARALQPEGIKPVDALHLASAVAAKADYFCTCDDQFLKRAKAVDTGQTKVVSPLELIAEVTQ
ncbi:MAG: PIN domain-containing protein [Candidatus Tectomicrobia bacterium]|uniref:PIN domain-containing protein n=1 Tax=Tectimicrobiota bacterium TaxID=2528274 RepID=A0A932GMU4_UNCTE|nr:PIN domain-containing protein [Candidatus Tectomicrobia bacterium]